MRSIQGAIGNAFDQKRWGKVAFLFFIATFFVLPLWLAWNISIFSLKFVLFILLLLMGPFGWGVIAGWLYGKNTEKLDEIVENTGKAAK